MESTNREQFLASKEKHQSTFAYHYYVIRAAGAMDDQNISAFVKSAYDARVAVP